jgi:hypothetical protein
VNNSNIYQNFSFVKYVFLKRGCFRDPISQNTPSADREIGNESQLKTFLVQYFQGDRPKAFSTVSTIGLVASLVRYACCIHSLLSLAAPPEERLDEVGRALFERQVKKLGKQG